jgi:hypothetical protein
LNKDHVDNALEFTYIGVVIASLCDRVEFI